jgi:transposase
VRKTREILRLKYEAGLSVRAIVRAGVAARSTVQELFRRFAASGLAWPPPAEVDDAALEAQLYRRTNAATPVPLPDFAQLQIELRQKGVTRQLLWQEYRDRHPAGLGYSAFCDQFRLWLKAQDAVMRQVHKPGEKLFVDYAGATLALTDRRTGEIRPVSLFVAALGASSYTYAEATAGQTSADWLMAQRRALEFIGGVVEIIVPDNPRPLVSRACRYEPDLNPAYQDFAEHYGVAIVPARVATPRDKAKVEVAVQVAERWIIARLRHRIFFSLGELNAAIRELLVELNARPFKKRPGSRREAFEALDRPALRPLPLRPYEFGTWKKAKVHLDYHVQIERHCYSVPCALIGKTVDVRLAERTLEIFLRGQRVAAHPRIPGYGFTTVPEHRPPNHRAWAERFGEPLRLKAAVIGPATAEVIARQQGARKHPEYTLRACQGILRLARDFSPERLEAAAERALAIGTFSYKNLRALIQIAPAAAAAAAPIPAPHEHLRGADYYQ